MEASTMTDMTDKTRRFVNKHYFKVEDSTNLDLSKLVETYIAESGIRPNKETNALTGFLKGVQTLQDAQIKVQDLMNPGNNGTLPYHKISYILETGNATHNDRCLLMATILRTTREALGLIQDIDDVFGLRLIHEEDGQKKERIMAVYNDHETGRFSTAGLLEDFFLDTYKDLEEVIRMNARALRLPSAKVSLVEFREEDIDKILSGDEPIPLREGTLCRPDHAKIYKSYTFTEETPIGTVEVLTSENNGFGIMTSHSPYIAGEDVGELGNIITEYLVYYFPNSDRASSLLHPGLQDVIEVYIISKKDPVTEHTVAGTYIVTDNDILELIEIYESIGEENDEIYASKKDSKSAIYKLDNRTGKFETYDGKIFPYSDRFDEHAGYIFLEGINITGFLKRYYREQTDGTYDLLFKSEVSSQDKPTDPPISDTFQIM